MKIDQMLKELKAPEGTAPVITYVADFCPTCRSLERDLQAKNIKYFKADVENNDVAKVQYLNLMGPDAGPIPVIVMNDEIAVGYRKSALLDKIVKIANEPVAKATAPANAAKAPALTEAVKATINKAENVAIQ